LTADRTVKNSYEELGVEPGEDDAGITAAYRRLAHEFHPDIAGESATGRMSRINAAFDRIRDVDRRAAYDAELLANGTPAVASSERTSAAAARRWGREPDGTGGAGPPPGRPSGSVLPFGLHIGWSIGEIARVDPGYLAWLEDHKEARPYLTEIDLTLRRVGYRREPVAAPKRSRARGRPWR
jgi:curved DNA-binding protein CbpA